jgi:membrane-bound acyltransferase YfiQ involved in biofilm formation
MYPEFIGLGIAWFLALLLIFSFGYAAWRMLRRNRTSSSQNVPSPPSYLGIGIFILGLALVSYLVRIVVPIGRTVLDFPTLAYLPQYLSFFVIGIIAYPRNWFRTIPGSMGVVGFVIALVATILLFPVAFFGGLTGEFLGYGQWQSAVYTLWDSIFAVGMSLAAITFFRRFFNKDSGFGRFLSQQSYAVYIIHPPIIVFLAFALSGIVLGSFLKFGLLTVIVIPTCFVVAYIIRKIPGVSRVL